MYCYTIDTAVLKEIVHVYGFNVMLFVKLFKHSSDRSTPVIVSAPITWDRVPVGCMWVIGVNDEVAE